MQPLWFLQDWNLKQAVMKTSKNIPMFDQLLGGGMIPVDKRNTIIFCLLVLNRNKVEFRSINTKLMYVHFSNAHHNYDAGDCCYVTCVPSTYTCGRNGYSCATSKPTSKPRRKPTNKPTVNTNTKYNDFCTEYRCLLQVVSCTDMLLF